MSTKPGKPIFMQGGQTIRLSSKTVGILRRASFFIILLVPVADVFACKPIRVIPGEFGAG